MADRRWSALPALVGGLLVAVAVWDLAGTVTADEPLVQVAAVAMIGGSGVGVLALAYWFSGRDYLSGRYPRLTGWLVAGVVLFAVVGTAALFAGSESVTDRELLVVLRFSGSVGVFAGLLIGAVEAQAIASAESAARARAEAETVAAERERLERVNGLVRHYVCNAVTAISGYADHLASAVPPAEREKLDRIDEHARSIATLIDHANKIGASERGAVPETDADLDAVVDSAVANLRSRPGLTVVTPDEGPSVRTTEHLETSLHLVCDALATAADGGTIAIEHDRGRAGEVVLAVETSDAELPQSVTEHPFQPGRTGIALRLYLASELHDALALRTESDATRIELTLSREAEE